MNQLRWKLQSERKLAQNAMRPREDMMSFRSSFDSHSTSLVVPLMDETELLRSSIRSLSHKSPSCTLSSPGTLHGQSACSSPGNVKANKQVFYPKIERFHRPMLQREIFRQKFDFLYRRIKDEVDDEESSAAADETGGTVAPAATADLTIQAASTRQSFCQSRATLHRRRRNSRGGGPAPGRPMQRAASAPGGKRSAPLHCQGLTGVYDEYYEGNDLLIHEDVLHCSNPRLFPLRDPGHSKPFPITNLATC